jgi:hypothetical protein
MRQNYHESLFLEFSPSSYLHSLTFIFLFYVFHFLPRFPLLKHFMLQQKRKLPFNLFLLYDIGIFFYLFSLFYSCLHGTYLAPWFQRPLTITFIT